MTKRSSARAGCLAAALAVTLSAMLFSAGLVEARSRVYLAACSVHDLEMKPSEWSTGCVGAAPYFREMRWRHWGTRRTRSTGIVWLNDCDPSCAGGEIYEYSARLTAYRIRRCGGRRSQRQYTRIRTSIRYPAGNPFGVRPGWRLSTWKVGRGCSR